MNTLFMGVVGAVSVAAAIAFGWGGFGLALEIVRKWHHEGNKAAPKHADASEPISQEIQRGRT
ncbi:hypothetical protein [Variovorax sp. OV329]|uniref:hypothetical protein n=1 Tax=Variovorax sp. OV329 TaxID=1882825 RepID=UPI000B85A41A|nr:hypothetical protein [Variovorax sp. OV329]